MSYTNKTALFLQEKFEVTKKAIRIALQSVPRMLVKATAIHRDQH
jgi:hypothetical protein